MSSVVADEPYKVTITLYWSDEREAYLAEVPNLPGCQAQGASYEQALASVKLEIAERLNKGADTSAELSKAAPVAKEGKGDQGPAEPEGQPESPRATRGLSLEEAVKDMKRKGKL